MLAYVAGLSASGGWGLGPQTQYDYGDDINGRCQTSIC